ncbi:diguanylate cyclase [Bacillota bacterium]
MANHEEILESLLAISFDLIFITDLSGYVLNVNRACLDVLGYTKAEFENRSISDFVHPDNLSEETSFLDNKNRSKMPSSVVSILKCKDGTYKHIEWRVCGGADYLCFTGKEAPGPRALEALKTHGEHMHNRPCAKAHEKDTPEAARKKILLVDDSVLNLMLLTEALSDEYEVITAVNGKEAIALAESDSPPDIILLDIIMPGMSGYEVCQRLSDSNATKDIPVIFVTGMQDEKNQEQGLSLGAIDYITKPFSVPIIKAKIKNHLELKEYNDVLKSSSWKDELTQIANRRRYDAVLESEIRRSRRGKSFISVLIADIDSFKKYNDTYGHLAGDKCLQKVAQAIVSSLKRPGDLAARWGGEEFSVLLPETDRASALYIGENIRQAVESMGIPHEASPVTGVVTISIGVSTMDPSKEQSAESLFLEADRALYNAKKLGKNRICVDDES